MTGRTGRRGAARILRWGLGAAAIVEAAACRLEDLVDVPIVGGTAEQRALVAEAIDGFLRDTREHPLQLRKVEIVDLAPPELAGDYRHADRRIRIDAELDPEGMEKAVRHELCHALRRQDADLDEALPPLDGEFELLPRRDSGAMDDARKGSEVFAYWCTLGPEIAAYAPRDLEPPVDRVLEILREQVWVERPGPVALGPGTTAMDLVSPAHSLIVAPTAPGVVLVRTASLDSRAPTIGWYDLDSGEPLARGGPPLDAPVDAPIDGPPGLEVSEHTGKAPLLALARVEVGYLGVSVVPLAWDGSWRVIDGVPEGVPLAVFEAEGERWAAALDRGRVTWWPVIW